MRTRISMAGAAVVALVLSLLVAVPPAQAQSGGFSISGQNLVDANGNTFIMRGTSHPHVWYSGQTSSFANIANLGANTVRVVLGSGQRWGPNSASDVQSVINMCKENRLICMLEVHDTTGFGEEGAAATLDQAVTYWNSIRNALIGQEAYILINIGNEPWGNNNAGDWTNATVNAVQRMRTLGFTHTLVVDAPNWGQDWQNNMRNNAQTIWNADTQRNTLFSIHMYEVYSSASSVTSYFDDFQQMNLPLIVGEFGHVHNGQNVAYQTIMSQAQQRGIGWVAWSWSGNSGGAEALDQSNNFNPNSLTQWGEIVFNGANGIAQTAQCATVYSGCGGGGPQVPAAPTGLTVSGTTNSSISLSWSGSTGATSYVVERAPGTSGGSFTQVGTASGTSFTNTGLSADQTFRYRVVATNTAGSSPPSGVVTGTTTGGGGQVPAAPTGLTVSGTTNSSISLSWSGSTGATGYVVERAPGTSGGSFTQVGTASGTSFTNTGLSADQTFRYRVVATNSAGSSPPSGVVTGTTTGGGGTGGCSAVGTVQTQWGSGYVVQPVTVTNTGSSSIGGWSVTFTLPAGHSVVGSWNAQFSATSGSITATNMGYNGALSGGGNTSFGFQVSRPDGNTQTPGSYTCTAS